MNSKQQQHSDHSVVAQKSNPAEHPAPVTQHTPGPWVIGQHDGAVCDCNGFYINQKHPANARLIAAAPELLEALEHTVDTLENVLAHYAPSMSHADRLSREAQVTEYRTLIAKARGEKS